MGRSLASLHWGGHSLNFKHFLGSLFITLCECPRNCYLHENLTLAPPLILSVALSHAVGTSAWVSCFVASDALPTVGPFRETPGWSQ